MEKINLETIKIQHKKIKKIEKEIENELANLSNTNSVEIITLLWYNAKSIYLNNLADILKEIKKTAQ